MTWWVDVKFGKIVAFMDCTVATVLLGTSATMRMIRRNVGLIVGGKARTGERYF